MTETTFSYDHELCGRTVTLETDSGQRVQVHVTSVESNGTLWGYRVFRQRGNARPGGLQQPRPYNLPNAPKVES